jgi:uncharacterized protein (TIGR02266 family)
MQGDRWEQRRTARVHARVRVLYFSKGQPRAVDAACDNISADGLFVRTRRRGPVAGTPVSLLLHFPGSERELMVEGVVRWQGSVESLDDGTEGSGMGIQFTTMDDAMRAQLIEQLTNAEVER